MVCHPKYFILFAKGEMSCTYGDAVHLLVLYLLKKLFYLLNVPEVMTLNFKTNSELPVPNLNNWEDKRRIYKNYTHLLLILLQSEVPQTCYNYSSFYLYRFLFCATERYNTQIYAIWTNFRNISRIIVGNESLWRDWSDYEEDVQVESSRG